MVHVLKIEERDKKNATRLNQLYFVMMLRVLALYYAIIIVYGPLHFLPWITKAEADYVYEEGN